MRTEISFLIIESQPKKKVGVTYRNTGKKKGERKVTQNVR